MSDRTPALDAVHGMLTLLFAAVALHMLWHAVRSPGAGRRDRVDLVLHCAMAAAMAAMPWSSGPPLSGRAATVFFTAAALWFLLTARTAAVFTGRLTPAVGMAAMAWMSRPPSGAVPVSAATRETVAAAGVPAAHHTAAHGHAADASTTATLVTVVLTVYLLGCALRSLTRPMPALRTAADHAHRAAAANPYGHVRDGAMALGTAVMLLLPH
ncbi:MULTISPECIES: DUF5134 domain-containing protein [Streptomyces]|uniref:DUF5134 domain-containing protein n=1 Tax=Streptomyces TaxID=1883 RepID=UPI00109ECBA9|nr:MULTISPECIES: DUF5134 domain-containing protein [Streptomyces]THA99304.1 DUF5134 domain-containing protein [Streptomyces sp. LRa12]WTE16784.1 DUF5134 domain-containing protein [Streptomyces anthocyanicus]